MDYRSIITLEPGKRSGKPCIRGMRITVYDVLESLALGMTHAEITSPKKTFWRASATLPIGKSIPVFQTGAKTPFAVK